MQDADHRLLDIFAPAHEPPRAGRLAWTAIAGAVGLAGCAVAIAFWQAPTLLPPHASASNPFDPPAPRAGAEPRSPATDHPVPATPIDAGRPYTPADAEAVGFAAESPASEEAGSLPPALPRIPWLAPGRVPLETPLAMVAPVVVPHGKAPDAATTARPRPRATLAVRPARATRPSAEEARRCRSAVKAAQIGEELTATELALMRAGCGG